MPRVATIPSPPHTIHTAHPTPMSITVPCPQCSSLGLSFFSPGPPLPELHQPMSVSLCQHLPSVISTYFRPLYGLFWPRRSDTSFVSGPALRRHRRPGSFPLAQSDSLTGAPARFRLQVPAPSAFPARSPLSPNQLPVLRGFVPARRLTSGCRTSTRCASKGRRGGARSNSSSSSPSSSRVSSPSPPRTDPPPAHALPQTRLPALTMRTGLVRVPAGFKACCTRHTHKRQNLGSAAARRNSMARARAQRQTGEWGGEKGRTGKTTRRMRMPQRLALGGLTADRVRSAKNLGRGGVREKELHGACEGRSRKNSAPPLNGCF